MALLPRKVSAAQPTDDPTEIPRNKRGQPLVKVQRPWPTKKEPDRTKEVLVPYTRMTTFIDCLDDKSNLTNWKGRKALEGVFKLDDLELFGYRGVFNSALDRVDKKKMDELVWELQVKAGSEEKSEKGTLLHKLSEYADRGEQFPAGTSELDIRDIAAYSLATADLDIQLIEQFVVLDDYKVGGTPDRISKYHGNDPDGNPAGTLITDLKTGSTAYGGLKMAMQLSGYAHARLYDPITGLRTDLADDINLNWGLIINAPAGTGECTVLWIDLQLGWEAFQLAKQVRAMRNRGKKAFRDFGSNSVVSEGGEDEDDESGGDA